MKLADAQRRYEILLREILAELVLAETEHSPYANGHEGIAVLAEEVWELWDEVREKKPDREQMHKEAIQVAAVALRFVHDVCGPSQRQNSERES